MCLQPLVLVCVPDKINKINTLPIVTSLSGPERNLESYFFPTKVGEKRSDKGGRKRNVAGQAEQGLQKKCAGVSISLKLIHFHVIAFGKFLVLLTLNLKNAYYQGLKFF